MFNRRIHRAALCGSAAAGALLALTMPVQAVAQTATYSFDIPAQDISAALIAYGRTARQQLVFDGTTIRNKKSSTLVGEYPADTGLYKLLEGTGLRAEFAGDGAVRIVDAADPQSGSAAGDGADGTVEALIVTAQKREEDIQDVPIAISAFSQEDLTRSQIAGGPDLMTQVPNMTFTKTNFSSYSIQIRGIGTQAISATTDPAVAVAFNNTPFVRNHFFEQEFYDLQRVEVLRGPQGTLYGRNATAGVVNVISAKPKHIFEAKLSGDLANYSSSRLEGMVNIPLVEDKVALRIAGAWTKREGFVKNTLTGEQTDGRDLWSTRVTLGLEPADWFSANLIWEHFEEKDDRLRSGKQLCRSDPGPATLNGFPIPQEPAAIGGINAGYLSQGCLSASMYSPDSFDTPNGLALGYYGPLSIIGSPTYLNLNPYASKFQSRNLREIETHLTPEYEASADLVELQINIDLPHDLSLSSETGYSRDRIFSFEDYNRFDTTPGIFVPGAARYNHPDDYTGPGGRLDVVDLDGYFCDPQLGCTNRLAAGDLSAATSTQFSQEFRLSSNFDGPFNFNLGANFLRYDTVEKYYVFINTITAFIAANTGVWEPGVTDNAGCVMADDFYGPHIADPSAYYSVFGACHYVDPNDIHHLNDQGRNYFLSKNPYHLLSYAAFGEAYYNFTDNLKLTVGLRWTIDKKTAPIIPTWLLAGAYGPNRSLGSSYGLPTYKVIEQEWREPTGRIALDWKPELSFTDETLLYGSYVRGYKAGGANPPPPVLVLATQCPPECGDEFTGGLVEHYLTHPEKFEPEFVHAFELGTKNTLLDGTLTANISAFYYDYTGYQISQIVDRSAINFNFDAKIWGIELEMDWRPLENLKLGFKGGYENTRVADGMEAVDTMDRTAGREGWVVYRPFPTLPSNCVVPTWLAIVGDIDDHNPIPSAVCASYALHVDPVTLLPYVPNPTEYMVYAPPPGYPGYDPDAPTSANNGQGWTKDLSGNKLPNAPDFTATITADYTLPLPNDWLMTLHTDLYYQSEAWTRIFNTPGYDKLKAYNNINFAAIFTNEDAGWNIMAYVKNVLDRDSITGAFLNSDDTGLTTNVFLTEPRLYGVRVTKAWTGGPLLGGFGARREGPYPFMLEYRLQAQRLDAPGEVILPFTNTFSSALDPTRPQTEDLDWIDGQEWRLTYQPTDSSWKASAGVRYGRTSNDTGPIRKDEVVGDPVCSYPTSGLYHYLNPGIDFGFLGKLRCDPQYPDVTMTVNLSDGPSNYTFVNKYRPENLLTATNRLSAAARHLEEHMLVDFALGKDVGIGAGFLGESKSSLSVGLRYAEFRSFLSGEVRGIPDMKIPEAEWKKYNTTFHQYAATFAAEREFDGVGPAISWEVSKPVLGNAENGHLNVDWTVTGGALFGKQETTVSGSSGSTYFNDRYPTSGWVVTNLDPPIQTPLGIEPRSKSVTVPMLDLSLGLSYETSGIKLGAGYRWERYFNVLDGGFEERKSYDRTIDGPYISLAIGFGG